MSNRTQGFLLLLFGVVLLRLGTTDLLLRFVRPNARPWVLAAGVLILVLAVSSLVAAARGEHESEPADLESAGDGHSHAGASRAAWLITLPVVAVLIVGPPALGSYTADRQSAIAVLPATQHFDPLPAGGTVPVRVFDFAARAVNGGGTTLLNRKVVMTGFVTRSTSGSFLLTRLVITCCAADALPIRIRVLTKGAAPKTDRWVRVTGTYGGQDLTSPDLPMLNATSVRDVGTPAQPYD